MSGRWTSDPATWPPPAERNREHWLIERGLREELLASAPGSRTAVTRELYNRLYREVPWHKANTRSSETELAYEEFWFRVYGPVCRPADTVVDVGCGRGGLVRRFARAVAEAVGVDASDAMIALCETGAPENARFLLGDAVDIPLSDRSADVVVSRQVMEHVHPDEARRHLREAFRVLRPGGRFLIETPSRLTGPWDISQGFSPTATGFHLREYTNAELGRLLREVGFRRVRGPALPTRLMARVHSSRAYVPVGVKAGLERMIVPLPVGARRQVAGALTVREVALLAERVD